MINWLNRIAHHLQLDKLAVNLTRPHKKPAVMFQEIADGRYAVSGEKSLMHTFDETGDNKIAQIAKTLDAKLLAIGGREVHRYGPEPCLGLIMERGQLCSQRVRLKLGNPNDCHGNASKLWADDPEKNRLFTGYALSSKDGIWVAHSWILRGETIIETTNQFDCYFGVELPKEEAWKFCMDNFLSKAYPDHNLPEKYGHLYPIMAESLRTNKELLTPAMVMDWLEGQEQKWASDQSMEPFLELVRVVKRVGLTGDVFVKLRDLMVKCQELDAKVIAEKARKKRVSRVA